MSAITDDEIAQHPIPGPHGSRRWCCDECSWKYEERLRERVRADAAKIARLEAVVDRVHTIADEECHGPHPVQSAEESLSFIERDLFRHRVALERINEIRNDIIGRQTVSFSLHVYPLVSALNKAGYVGADYETARAKVTSAFGIIERLRAVAVKALPMNGKCSHGIAGRTCSDAVEELRIALSALAPGDLGKDGE